MRRPRDRAGDGEDGFTVVEVVVAFAITALVTVAALEISGSVAGGIRRLDRARVAADEAEGVVLARAAARPLLPGLEQGAFSDGSPWTLSIVDARPALGLARVPPLWLVNLSRAPGETPLYTTLMPGEAGG